MKRKASAPSSAAPNRVDVPAAYVCQACRVNFMDLENRFRPDDWASPRDFIMTPRGILYAEASLPKLAASLAAHGQTEAAQLLCDYAAKIHSPPAATAAEEGELVAVERVAAAPDALDRMNAHVARRHPSDREEVPHSWAYDWETGHEA